MIIFFNNAATIGYPYAKKEISVYKSHPIKNLVEIEYKCNFKNYKMSRIKHRRTYFYL